MSDTIAAISTALGESGIGVIRISGKDAISIAKKVFQPAGKVSLSEIESHRVVYGHVKNPNSDEILDEALVIVMRAPRTYTREDTVEIDCHGGYMPQTRVFEAVLSAGARMAEPGEFTKRAFLNGRLDLTQAEAVIDVIRARTEASERQAIGQLAGNLGQKIREIRSRLVRCLARIEAAIDFPEDDIEETTGDELERELREVEAGLQELLQTADAGRVLREGINTVIIGRPNVGKSSLLNTLLREERAIVTEIPGTTRDVIEEVVNIKGVPLKITDTAGIRETEDIVEKMGVEKAKKLLEGAELVLLVLDAREKLTEMDFELMKMVDKKKVIVIVNKIDLGEMGIEKDVKHRLPDCPIVKTSLIEGNGVLELEEKIAELFFGGDVRPGQGATLTRVRHKRAVQQAVSSLAEARQTLAQGLPLDFVSIDITEAASRLGEISGETVRDDVIEEIFSQFCIGK